MEPFKDDNELLAELRGLRPRPRQEFAAELDEQAATGFPRRSSRSGSPLGPLFTRMRALPPWRLVLSAGTAALAAVAMATVVVAVSEPQNDSASLTRLSPTDRPGFAPEAPQTSDAGGSNGASGTASTESSVGATVSGPFASKTGHRNVERSAEMVLGADPTDVANDATRVFDAVHAAGGIVLSSSVTGGAAGDARARFDLLIPAAKLSDALANFSAIDMVVSRHEATDDITAPTVRVGEHLRDSRATIDGLLVRLAGADTDSERAEVEAELRAERGHAAALRSQATKLDRRANLSRVSLRIETGAAATSSDEGSEWSVGDALGDAGHILAIAAGVTIVGLAILAPLALLAFLAWLANRVRIRQARERALN